MLAFHIFRTLTCITRQVQLVRGALLTCRITTDREHGADLQLLVSLGLRLLLVLVVLLCVVRLVFDVVNEAGLGRQRLVVLLVHWLVLDLQLRDQGGPRSLTVGLLPDTPGISIHRTHARTCMRNVYKLFNKPESTENTSIYIYQEKFKDTV